MSNVRREGGPVTCGGEDEGRALGAFENSLDVVDDRLGELGEGGRAVILIVPVHSPHDRFGDVDGTGDKQVVPAGGGHVIGHFRELE